MNYNDHNPYLLLVRSVWGRHREEEKRQKNHTISLPKNVIVGIQQSYYDLE
jgi:hypothetical protein